LFDEPVALTAKGGPRASVRRVFERAVDTRRPGLYRNFVEGLHQFLEILIKPDNIPIVGMLVLVLFFTWLGFKQALRNDRLEEQGRESEILKEMQE
jgi:hypothetical protein